MGLWGEDFLCRTVALAKEAHLQTGPAHLQTVSAVIAEHRPTAAFAAGVSVRYAPRRLVITASVFRNMPLFRHHATGRDIIAWLCRRWTGATLSPPGRSSGLKAIDSVANLVRRAEKRSNESAAWLRTAKEIDTVLKLNTERKLTARGPLSLATTGLHQLPTGCCGYTWPTLPKSVRLIHQTRSCIG